MQGCQLLHRRRNHGAVCPALIGGDILLRQEEGFIVMTGDAATVLGGLSLNRMGRGRFPGGCIVEAGQGVGGVEIEGMRRNRDMPQGHVSVGAVFRRFGVQTDFNVQGGVIGLEERSPTAVLRQMAVGTVFV